MRMVITGLLAAGLVAQTAQAADCLRPADTAALDVVGLKTQLMVAAVTCQESERYNAFIRKYQGDLQREDKSMSAYFSRAYGRTGTKQRDDYVTNLANVASRVGLSQGSAFCTRNVPVFEEVMALRSNAELADFAAAKGLTPPMKETLCGETSATPVRTAASHTTRRKKS